jgi:two-component system cell cycle sensor histidine kinase/response regulator CckA
MIGKRGNVGAFAMGKKILVVDNHPVMLKFMTHLLQKEGLKRAALTGDARPGARIVLIVDDEEMVLDVGRKFLEVLGYWVLAAGKGHEAIALYESHREIIDLVILDLVMPNLGGDKVFDRLKEINPNVRVLLSSGYSIDGEATRLLERGCAGFIQKPFNIEQLSQSLKAIVDRKERVLSQ